MNTCGTCKYFGEPREIDWWDSETEQEGTITKFHVCDLIKHINGGNTDRKASADAAAGVVDGSGYFAAFCVSDEFGCNQWKPRVAVQP